MTNSLLRIDYRMREDVFVHSQFVRVKKCKNKQKKRIKTLYALSLIIILVVSCLIQVFILIKQHVSGYSFWIGLGVEALILLLFAVFGRQLITTVIKRKFIKQFQNKKLETTPCHVTFYDKTFEFCINSEEKTVDYKDIFYILDCDIGFTILTKNCEDCVSIPKETLGEKNIFICRDLFIEKCTDVYENKCII